MEYLLCMEAGNELKNMESGQSIFAHSRPDTDQASEGNSVPISLHRI